MTGQATGGDLANSPGPIERLWAWPIEGDKRAQWLAAGDAAPHVGADFILGFRRVQRSSQVCSPPELTSVGERVRLVLTHA